MTLRRYTKPAAFFGLPALALLVGITGWYSRPHAAPLPAAPEPTAETKRTTTVRPEQRTIRRTIEQPGQIEGFEQTPLFAKIAGYVAEWKHDIGDAVRKDDVLAVLSVPEIDEELRQKEAAVALADATITQTKRALAAAEANLNRSKALLESAKATQARAEPNVTRWQADNARTERLLRSRGASEQDLEVSTDQLRTAEAALGEAKAGVQAAAAAVSAAEAQRDKAEADVQVAEAQRQVAEADRKHTAAVLGYATIKAPFDGVVTKRTVDVGQFVQPASGPGGAAPLFVVVRTNPVRIFVDTPEIVAPFVARGTPARIRVQALRDGEVTGAVTRSSWVLDNQTRTLRTQVDLPNDDQLLRPGMYASARITVERPGAWMIPASAVRSGDDHPYVVLREGGKDVRTPVKLGARQGDLVEVLQKQTKAKQDGYPAAWEPFTGGEEVVAEIRDR